MILIFDVETTNLPNKNYQPRGRIIQIAWEIYDNNRNLLKHEDFIVPVSDEQIGFEALAVHGITREIANKYGDPNAISYFIEDLKNVDILVSHNIEFDLSYVLNEIYLRNIDYDIDKFQICTMKSGKYYMKSRNKSNKYPKLSELYFSLFNAYIHNAHNAKFDVYYTSLVFWKLVDLNYITIPTKTSKDLEKKELIKINKWFLSLKEDSKFHLLSEVLGFNKAWDGLKNKFDGYSIDIETMNDLSYYFNSTKELCVNFEDIAYLKKFHNLEKLWFSSENEYHNSIRFNSIPDFSFLNKLTEISIDIASEDLSPLAKIVRLRSIYLSLDTSPIFETLSELKNLRSLHISSSKVISLKTIGALKQLSYLDIFCPEIIDISPIKELSNLKTLIINSSINKNQQFLSKLMIPEISIESSWNRKS